MNGNPLDPRHRQRRFGDPDLTRRILARTSGSACGRAEELLGARWDGALAAGDRELLGAHLERCAACRELALILDRLQPLLPGLAEREPGPAFTARVLARTVGSQPVEDPRQLAADGSLAPGGPSSGSRRGRSGPLERAALALQERLRRAWQRPRFALEAAWTVAALAALLVWGPLAPRGVPEQASVLVRAGAGTVPELVTAVETLGAAALATGREKLVPLYQRAEDEIENAVVLVRSWWSLARRLASTDDDQRPAAAAEQRPPAPR